MQAKVNTQMNDTANAAEADTVTDATANAAPLLETSFGNEQPVVTVPYSALRRSPLNARTKPLSGIDSLATNIRAKGLLQNNRNLSNCYTAITASNLSAGSPISCRAGLS
ncbi:hypothetical protein DLM46_33500 [Paraburkholderia lacunae]|uniref:Uncharacterized protein n=1 Tax=Paraburkholderia lacunae TaxID=2211104 RepID=A0A370MYM2_9BURK|nr:hypothetical protein [Paraburkholderia lacunae]RDJ98471.1 hypothetical protein DLM46_33500 [Paraburkholderia lacunae]